ncbi:MAG: hypothetical protein AABW90_00035 [Nanoarchaeota archaeon]
MKPDNKNWKKELARDFIALGSWVFYILVIARASIKPYRPFLDQIIIAGIFLLIAGFLFRNNENYISRGLILVVFTTLFYQNRIYSFFAILVFIGLMISSYFIGNDWKKMIKGLVIGGVISLIGWLLSNFSYNG